MKLKNFLDEAIILPDRNTAKYITTALFLIHSTWLKMPKINTGLKLHRFINRELVRQKKTLPLPIRFDHDSGVGNSIQGAAGPGNIQIVHNYDFTFQAWEDSRTFQTWLKALDETLKHELVHVEQIRRLEAGKNLSTTELIKILDGISAKFAKLDKNFNWVIEDWDLYLASKQEIMAHAQSAASAVLQGTDNPYLRAKGVLPPSPDYVIMQVKSTKGIKKLAQLSRHFDGYYKLRHHMPKVWRKFIRYFIDYIQSQGEGVSEDIQLNELFETFPEIDIDWWGNYNGATVLVGDSGTSITMDFIQYDKNQYRVGFAMKNRGKSNPMEIFMGAAKAIGEFIKRKKPEEMAFLPFDIRRQHIYQKILYKFIDKSKWNIVEEPMPWHDKERSKEGKQKPAEKLFLIRKK